MDTLKREWCNKKQKDEWFEKAKEESQNVIKAATKLKKAMEEIDYDALIEKVSKERPRLEEYIWFDIVEIQRYAYELSRVRADSDFDKVNTHLSDLQKELARKVYIENKDYISGKATNIRLIEKVFVEKLQEKVKKNSEDLNNLLNVKYLFEELLEMIDMLVDKKYNLSEETQLLKILGFEKQIFYATNQLKRANEEAFGNLSKICDQTINYYDNAKLIEDNIKLHR